jgi:hypothetical protein
VVHLGRTDATQGIFRSHRLLSDHRGNIRLAALIGWGPSSDDTTPHLQNERVTGFETV